jgi:hypothetical protein
MLTYTQIFSDEFYHALRTSPDSLRNLLGTPQESFRLSAQMSTIASQHINIVGKDNDCQHQSLPLY